jgi:hypothetical protein
MSKPIARFINKIFSYQTTYRNRSLFSSTSISRAFKAREEVIIFAVDKALTPFISVFGDFDD